MDYSKFIGKNAGEIKPSGIRKFFDIVATTEDAISLGVGEPDFATPYNIRNSAISSLQKGYTKYTSNAGMIELREKIAEYLSHRFGVNYKPDKEIIVTVGASEAIDITLRAICNPGDEILIAEPCFVSYSPCVVLAGAKPIAVRCDAQSDFRLTAQAIKEKITPKTKAILLCFPSNPTGAIMQKQDLQEIAKIVIENDMLVISDEIYAELTYQGNHISIASLPHMAERTVLVSGFSKAFSMTGWRIGYLACPKELASVILKIHQYAIMCAPSQSQYGALTALTDGLKDNFSTVCEMRDEFDRRRKYIYNALLEMGFSCFMPLGAFYIFPSVTKFAKDGDEFAQNLLETQKVAVVPGSAFGDGCSEHIRISYAYSMKNLSTALARINKFTCQKV